MTEKELKRLTRAELLEMLLEQTKRIDDLSEELSAVKAKLASKEIAIANSGSLADAALAVSGIMESAQKAADLYLENLKSNSESSIVSVWTADENDRQTENGDGEDQTGTPDAPEKDGKPETKREKKKREKEEAKKAKQELKAKKNGEKKHVGLFGRKAKPKDNGADEK